MGLHTHYQIWVKRKTQYVGSWRAPALITIAGQTVDVTDKFTYLGSDIDSSGYCSPDIRRRLGLVSSIMAQVGRVWRNKRLSTPTKIRIYSTCDLSVMLYGSESWTLLAEDSRRVQSFLMTCQRPTPHETFKHPRNYRKETSFSLRPRSTTIPEHTSKRRLTAASVSGQEIAGGALPVRLVAASSLPRRSWISQLEEYRDVSARILWRAAEKRSGLLDDAATVHENDHHLSMRISSI